MNRAQQRCVFAALLATPAVCAADPSASVIEILERVEAKGADVDDLKCDLVYTVDDRITDDTTKRTGTIQFKKQRPNPRFLVTFAKLIQDGVVHRTRRWYLFDGRYLFEANERSKSIIRRDIAPPGKEIDLFSIEKAPFPIPFGQKKAEILHHFNVTLGESTDADVDHLICTPKKTSRLFDDYSVVEFHVSRTLNLPTKIVMTTNPPDKVMTAEFPKLTQASINNNLRDSSFELPRETKKYAVSNE